jgi:RNA polymerase sporulation-specific sigma factor
MKLTEDRYYLVTENKGLVGKYARKMARSNKDPALDYEDYYSMGCIGLVHEAAGYDESSGLRFSTYAVPCILGFIKRYKNRGRTLKTPVLVVVTASAIMKDGLHDAPINELAARYKVTTRRIEDALFYIFTEVISANAPLTYDAESSYMESFESPKFDPTSMYVEEFLNLLRPKEKQIVTALMNGLNGPETGNLLGVSRQRIGIKVKEIRGKWLEYDQEMTGRRTE